MPPIERPGQSPISGFVGRRRGHLAGLEPRSLEPPRPLALAQFGVRLPSWRRGLGGCFFWLDSQVCRLDRNARTDRIGRWGLVLQHSLRYSVSAAAFFQRVSTSESLKPTVGENSTRSPQ
jgi:hypothetical protein